MALNLIKFKPCLINAEDDGNDCDSTAMIHLSWSSLWRRTNLWESIWSRYHWRHLWSRGATVWDKICRLLRTPEWVWVWHCRRRYGSFWRLLQTGASRRRLLQRTHCADAFAVRCKSVSERLFGWQYFTVVLQKIWKTALLRSCVTPWNKPIKLHSKINWTWRTKQRPFISKKPSLKFTPRLTKVII